MRIGDLAKATGVPVATLKFYLREGLLPSGVPTAVNQAEYDDLHVRRVKLVRALLHLGGLSIADTQRVLAAVDDETMPIHDAFGVAQDAMVPKPDRTGRLYAEALAEVDRFVRRHHLRVRQGAAVRGMLADAVVGLAECDLLGEPVGDTCELFDVMVPAMVQQAEWEVATTPDPASRTQQVEHTVVGTVVFEVAYAALRRMALEHASAGRWGGPERLAQ